MSDQSVPINIQSLRGVLQIKVLSPDEWETLESLPEDKRGIYIIRSAIINSEDLYIKLNIIIKPILIHAMFEGDFEPYIAKLQEVYNEVLDACYKANCLRAKFGDEEECDNLTISLVDGKLVSKRKES